MPNPVLLLLLVLFIVVDARINQAPKFEGYNSHPCIRPCVERRPQNCYYDFTIEHYYTLSKACYDCPYNQSDCFRPHCIPADGTPRGVLVVNRRIPGPAIQVCKGDTVIIKVDNGMINGEGTSLHWHGIHQRETPYMDGVAMVTQCPILSSTSIEYRFKADNSGTHFWHAHSGLQRMDGLYGAFIVRDTPNNEPNLGLYEEDRPDHVIIVNDWLVDMSGERFAHDHHSDGDNKPESILINGKGVLQEFFDESDNTTAYTPVEIFHVQQGRRYRFRTISSGILFCPIQISVDNHTLTMIASDGNAFDKVEVQSFNIFAGERYDFILSATQPVGSYWVRARGLGDCSFKQARQVAILRYDGATEVDPADDITWEEADKMGKELNPLNEVASEDKISVAQLTTLNLDKEEPLKEIPDKKFYLAMDLNKLDNYHFHYIPYYRFADMKKANLKNFLPQINHISFAFPPSPPLSQLADIPEDMFCNHDTLSEYNCSSRYCECIHRLQVALGDDVELVVIDEGVTFNANHPVHLHGHNFRVVGLEKLNQSTSLEEVKRLDTEGRLPRNLTHAVAKDTVTVPDGGYSILRFRATNPGFWFFHCHIQFHAEIGMGLIIQVGDQNEMPPKPKRFPECGNWQFTGYHEGEPVAPELVCKTNKAAIKSIDVLLMFIAVVTVQDFAVIYL